jgi:hypothetical protein
MTDVASRYCSKLNELGSWRLRSTLTHVRPMRRIVRDLEAGKPSLAEI